MPAIGSDPAAEDRHPPGPESAWAETFVFDVWEADGTLGAFTWLTLLPAAHRAWYWTVLARAGEPLVHVADLAVPLPAAGLRVRTTGLWADHHCEAPFEQWTVRNECHAVALDDPADALDRAYGISTPIAMDIEWYATAAPEAVEGGYEQRGEAHAVIETAGGPVELRAEAGRRHTWGEMAVAPSPLPSPEAGLRAYLATGSGAIVRTLTAAGWATGHKAG